MGEWPVWVVCVVYALATTRLTGLVTTDEITRPTRDAIITRLSRHPRVRYWAETLITCPWCASIWIAAPIAPLIVWHAASAWLLVPAVGLALSQVAGMLSSVGRG